MENQDTDSAVGYEGLTYEQQEKARDTFLTNEEIDTYFAVKNGRGRPAKEIPLDELERACRLMPTDEDLALMFDVDVRTIERRQKKKAFRAAMERGKAQARESLRRAQFRVALGEGRSATTMLIWLGKQHLGQKDKIVNEHSGLEGGPIQIADVRKRLDRLIARRAEPGPAPELPIVSE